MNWSELGVGKIYGTKKWDLKRGKGEGIMSQGWPNENLWKNILDNWIQLPLKRTMQGWNALVDPAMGPTDTESETWDSASRGD